MAAKLQIVRNYIGSCMTRYLRRRLRSGAPFAIISRYDRTEDSRHPGPSRKFPVASTFEGPSRERGFQTKK